MSRGFLLDRIEKFFLFGIKQKQYQISNMTSIRHLLIDLHYFTSTYPRSVQMKNRSALVASRVACLSFLGSSRSTSLASKRTCLFSVLKNLMLDTGRTYAKRETVLSMFVRLVFEELVFGIRYKRR
jgi:hypothetical protein